MEHPTEILLNPTDLKVQRTLFGLVFEQMPTYNEILNGTPKLSWIFELSSGFEPEESSVGEPIAWLSELYKEREYIALSVRELSACIQS
jgi:hypothetical protein